MSTKKHLRIYAFQETVLGNRLAGYAALFNGGHHQFGLKGLTAIAESETLQYPSTNKGIVVNPFPNSITIDRTNEAGETICIMAIELVELADLKTTENEENN